MGKSAHCEPSDNRVSLRPSFRQTSALPMPRSSARLLAIALGLTLRAERTRSCTVLLRRRRAQFRFARTGLAHGRVLRLRGSLCGTLRRGRLTCLRRSSGSYAFLAEFAGACCGQSGEAPTHTRKRFIDTLYRRVKQLPKIKAAEWACMPRVAHARGSFHMPSDPVAVVCELAPERDSLRVLDDDDVRT